MTRGRREPAAAVMRGRRRDARRPRAACAIADRAREAPQLAVLSALAHPEAEIAEAAIAGFDELSDADPKLYWDVILNGLPALVRQALEARMIKGYQYQRDFARKYYWQGHDEGLKQSHEEAREELRREVAVELAGAADEDGVRAALDRTLGSRA